MLTQYKSEWKKEARTNLSTSAVWKTVHLKLTTICASSLLDEHMEVLYDKCNVLKYFLINYAP